MTVACYMRVSSDEQRKRHTIGTQREQLERYASNAALPVAEWYADDGVSGTIPLDQRPAGMKLIADARAGRIARLLVYKLDRLGRDALVTLSAIDALDQCGVEIVSITQALELKTPHGRFMAVIDCGVSGYERDTLVERSIDGSARIARAGGWLGGPVPFGYTLSGSGSTARLVPNDIIIATAGMSEAEVVRGMYQRVADGWSCLRVGDWLTEIGVLTAFRRDGRTRAGQPRTTGAWAGPCVHNIIASTIYKGLRQYGKRSARELTPIAIAVPALVDVDLWERAQAAMAANKRGSSRNAKHEYLLRGLIICGECGRRYTGCMQITKHTRKIRYVCHGRTNARANALVSKCPGAAINGSDLEAQIWAHLHEWSQQPQSFADRVWAQLNTSNDSLADLRGNIRQIERALAGTAREREAVITLFRKGRIAESDLDCQLDEVEAEAQRLTMQIAQFRAQALAANEQISKFAALDQVLGKLFAFLEDADTPAKRRQIIERCVKRIVVRTVDGVASPEVEYQLDSLELPIDSRTHHHAYVNQAPTLLIAYPPASRLRAVRRA